MSRLRCRSSDGSPAALAEVVGEEHGEECAQQVAQAGVADRADPELVSFVDAALDDLAELGDWH